MTPVDSIARPLCSDFDELVDLCGAFYEAQAKIHQGKTQRRRASLSGYAGIFHRACGTLTPSVRERVDDLRDGNCILLLTCHQPYLFPYSGVFRKLTLSVALARKLEERTKVPVVSLFGIADQDFADDRWARGCQLPSVTRREGTMELEMRLPKKKMLNGTAKPSPQVLRKWKADVEKWLEDANRSVEKLREPDPRGPRPSPSAPTLHENAESFWDLVQECYDRAERYSDFNAFILSKIVNDVWGYDTVFARFSECQQAFTDDFGYLLSRFEDYSRSLKEAMGKPRIEGASVGVSECEPELVPFWYHCDCGSKARLFLARESDTLTGRGNCVDCGRHFDLELGTVDEPRLAGIAPRISARSIAMTLVFFRGLVPSCYIGGVGATGYLAEAQHVAKAIGIPFPPVAVWRPHDRYLGMGQVEALVYLKRICVSVGAHDYSEAEDLLVKRIHEVRGHLDELETSRERVLREEQTHPGIEALKEQEKAISMSETDIKREFNLSLLNRNLALLHDVPRVLDLIPSIMDYAVNIGLRETSAQWLWYLENVGDLSSDLHLMSVLSQDEGLRSSLSTHLTYCTDALRSKVGLQDSGRERVK
jgi:hypothetical protein